MIENFVNTEIRKKNNKNLLLLGLFIILIIVFLVLYFCFFANAKKGEKKDNKEPEEDRLEYKEPLLKYDYNNLGSSTMGIAYGKEKAKLGVIYDDLNENVSLVTVEDKEVASFDANTKFYGIYQITNFIVIVRDIVENNTKDAVIVDFDGNLVMHQQFSRDNMKISSFKVEGNIISVEYSMYHDKTITKDGKNINICNAGELQTNGINDDLIIKEGYNFVYYSDTNLFSYEVNDTLFKSVADIKATC